MSINRSPNFLRNILLFDAATCVVMGALLTLAAGPLAGLTSIPAGLLFYAGLILFPTAGFMAFVANKALHSRPAIGLIVVGNILWVAASVWLLVGGAIWPNALGYAFIAAQAFAVAVLAELEYLASRRSWAAATA